MNTHAINPDDPEDGETRRVIVTGGQRVGKEAIVDFEDLDRPGLSYRAVVFPGMARDGLGVGDQCLLRYRQASRHRDRPAMWDFVERTDEVAALTQEVMT
jgi:hypothetical protein